MAEPIRGSYKLWSAQCHETNKCAKMFLANDGNVSQEVMDKFFDHESEMFQAWRDSEAAPFDKDWSEDYNR